MQSTIALNRDFYINPPYKLAQQLHLKQGTILKVIKPLYSVLEAGNH
jgi:hypothetical protein